MARSSDTEILIAADNRSAMVVTLDTDFHMLLATTEANSPSVVRIREEGLKAPEFAELISHLIQDLPQALTQGAVVSATRDGYRMRRLPL